jgi:hypothetical protein
MIGVMIGRAGRFNIFQGKQRQKADLYRGRVRDRTNKL